MKVEKTKEGWELIPVTDFEKICLKGLIGLIDRRAVDQVQLYGTGSTLIPEEYIMVSKEHWSAIEEGRPYKGKLVPVPTPAEGDV